VGLRVATGLRTLRFHNDIIGPQPLFFHSFVDRPRDFPLPVLDMAATLLRSKRTLGLGAIPAFEIPTTS
jgi:hypothetical protein